MASSGGTGATSGGDSKSGGSKYKRLWRKTSRHNKHWANKTAECESGKDPNAIGGGARGSGVEDAARCFAATLVAPDDERVADLAAGAAAETD